MHGHTNVKHTSHLRMFMEIIAVCSEIHLQHTYTVWAERTVLWMLMLVVRIVTTGFLKA